MLLLADFSDNRSGSSLESSEKDVIRKEYLDKGIDQFDSQIKRFLESVGKGELYDEISSASSVNGLALVTLIAIALFLKL